MSVLHVLFPKVRAELLRILFADPDKEYHLRELARLSNLAVGTLQTEVHRLRDADLIQSRRDGNRLAFRANTSHPIFPELRAITLKTTGLREQIADVLAPLLDIELAFVFGSIASGKASARSDIDLMVIGDVGLRTLSPALGQLSQSLGREINPYSITAADFRSKARLGDAFIKNVIESPKLWVKGGSDELSRLAH